MREHAESSLVEIMMRVEVHIHETLGAEFFHHGHQDARARRMVSSDSDERGTCIQDLANHRGMLFPVQLRQHRVPTGVTIIDDV